MKCPLCSIELMMSERQGVEIDYCPKCRGVWLDRGELEKIIDRSASETMPREQAHHYNDHHDKQHYYKKRSFLRELFD